MRRRKAHQRRHSPPPDGPAQAPPAPAPAGPSPAGPRPGRGRLWLERALLMLLGPLIIVSATEGALRLLGYGYPTTFFIRSASGTDYITNDRFAWQFFSSDTPLRPFLHTVPARKPPGVIRICILGESAAMGTPDPAFSFGRILQAQLRRAYPDKQFELLNAAMRGINSYVIRAIARECAGHQVDLFIAYIGNNEVCGLHGPDPKSPPWAQSLLLIRAGQWARSTRLGQLLVGLAAGLLGPGDQAQAQDMAYFRQHRLRADDGRRQANRANFQANLQDICKAGTGAGARLLLCTVPVNLKDCPPLASLHRAGLGEADLARWEAACAAGAKLEAGGRYQEAVRTYAEATAHDGHYAELQFRLGQCWLAAGDAAQAADRYRQALDWDAMQFRADTSINGVIRRVAAANQGRGVRLVDTERAFAASPLSDGAVPGQRLFCDHVHPTFAGNDALARALYGPAVEALGLDAHTRPAAPPLSPQECAEAIGYTLYDELNIVSAMVQLTSRPPFLDQWDHARRQAAAEADIRHRLAAFSARDADACLAAYHAALQREPDFWPIRFNRASLCQELGRYSEAAAQFASLVERFPRHTEFRVVLALCLAKSGDRSGALAQLTRACRLDPADKTARRLLKQLQASTSASGPPPGPR